MLSSTYWKKANLNKAMNQFSQHLSLCVKTAEVCCIVSGAIIKVWDFAHEYKTPF